MGDYVLADVLRNQLQNLGGNVSNLGTSDGREQIEYIPLDQIDSDPNNFYDLSSLEELAANIELVGLQQPLRVRADPKTLGHVVIVSGHRRRAALQKLVDEGRTEFQEVPCIREAPAASAALQELRLIYANSDTRVLSSAELSRQAERVEQLLYQLKEEGMEFPGRMRDHVAEACKVSKSKLARLKVIRENLLPEFAKHYKANKLRETSAYTLAQQPADLQKLVWKYSDTKHMESLSEWQISNMLGKIKPVLERTCRRKAGGPPCEHQSVLLAKIFDDSYSYKPCDRMCCDKCEKLVSCKSACPLLAEKAKKLRTDRAAQNKQEKLARQERDRPEVEAISGFWEREATARSKAGKSIKELFKATGAYYSDENEKLWLERECLQKIKRDDALPFGMYGLSLSDARKLVATADFLGVTTDYLLGRTQAPGGVEEVSNLDTLPEAEPEEESEEEGEELGPPARRVHWESRGRTPPENRLILTYYLAKLGPRFRAVIWNGIQFRVQDGGEPMSNADFTHWIEIPGVSSGETVQLAPPGQPEGQLGISGWMPGGTFPRQPCEVVADFRAAGENGKPDACIRRICWFDGMDFLFKRHGPKLDAKCTRWMALPPVEDDVSKLDTSASEEERT